MLSLVWERFLAGYWHHHVVRPSARLSVTLCTVALRVGVQGKKLYQRVPSRQVPICLFKHLCFRNSRMRRLATKTHCFVACYVLLLTEIVRGLRSVTLEWIEFGCVHKLCPEESDCVPAVRKPKLVTETHLIVRKYNRLSQQQLSFCSAKWPVSKMRRDLSRPRTTQSFNIRTKTQNAFLLRSSWTVINYFSYSCWELTIWSYLGSVKSWHSQIAVKKNGKTTNCILAIYRQKSDDKGKINLRRKTWTKK